MIGLADFCCLDVDFDDAELGAQIGEDTITVDVVDGFTACDGFRIDGADVDDVAFQVYQVDIGVLIDSNEALGLLVPTDMGDISIRESVGLIVGVDALVFLIILIEVVRG